MPYTAPDTDWDTGTPYQQLPPWLRQNVADLNPAAGPMRRGFTPFTPPSNPLTRSPYEDEQFVPDVAATGVSGLGTTQQPAADLKTSGPGESAAKVLSGQVRMPPPTLRSAPAPTPTPANVPSDDAGPMPGPMPPPPTGAGTRMPPPGNANAAPSPVAPTPSPSASLSPAIQKAAERVAAGPPTMQSKGAMSVVQRLGMALLSATKLAPFAQQIVHPKYTEQMGQYKQAEDTLKELGAAQEQMQRGQWYEQQANESKGRYLRVGTGVFDQQSGKWVTMPLDKSNLVAISVERAQAAGLDTSQAENGHVFVPPQVASQIVKPAKDPANYLPITEEEGKRLSMVPDENGQYAIPKEGIAGYISNKEKPAPAPSAESQKIAFQSTISKLTAAGAPINALTDVNKLAAAIKSAPPNVLTNEEKNAALGYIAANPTPGMQPFIANIRAEGMAERTPITVIDTQTGQAMSMNMQDFNTLHRGDPNRYVASGVATPAMQRQATFAEIQTAIDYAKNSVAALKTIDAGTRAELANALSDESGGRIKQFLTGSAMATMTPEQRRAVIDLRNLYENALAMRSVQGLGQGSDQLRHAIVAALPNATSPDVQYMLDQLSRFEVTLGNLKSGTPGLGGPAAHGGATQNPNKSGGRGGRPSLDDIFLGKH